MVFEYITYVRAVEYVGQCLCHGNIIFPNEHESFHPEFSAQLVSLIK